MGDDMADPRWHDDADLDRVRPDSTAHDVTPGTHEPFGRGETGGYSAYSPVGGLHQELSLYRRLAERWGTPGRVIVWIVLLVAVLSTLSIVSVIWESGTPAGP